MLCKKFQHKLSLTVVDCLECGIADSLIGTPVSTVVTSGMDVWRSTGNSPVFARWTHFPQAKPV